MKGGGRPRSFRATATVLAIPLDGTARAIAVLAAIMADDTAAPEIRVTAANAILAWSRTGRSADAAATGKRDSALFPVGVEWFGPPFPNS